ncbi:MAG: rhomboid family intramembrane serine protease [Candidatus Kapaibacteriales bacterium]
MENNLSHKYSLLPISKIILVIFLFAHILFYFLNKEITLFLALNPQKVINYTEIWRLFTYPFVSLSIAEVVLFIFTFWVIAPKIEYYILNKPLLIVSYGVFILLQGIFSTLLFARENLYLVGTEGLSFGVITFYFLIFYRIVNQYQDVSLRFLIQTAFVIFFWIMGASVDSYIYQRPSLINAFGFALMGVTLGIISYYFAKPYVKELMDTRLMDYEKLRRSFLEPDVKYEPSHQDRQNFLQSDFPEAFGELSYRSVDTEFNEERLNKILDKINEQGKDALSKDELKFLENYSKFLNNFSKKE